MSPLLRRPAVLALGALALSGCRLYGCGDSTDVLVAQYETAVQEAQASAQRTATDLTALDAAAQQNPALRPVLASYHGLARHQDSLVALHAARLEAVKAPGLLKTVLGIGYGFRKTSEAYGALATEQAILNDRLSTLGQALAGQPTSTTYLDGMVEDSRFFWMPPFYHRLIAATSATPLLAAARAYRAPAAAPMSAPTSAPALVPPDSVTGPVGPDTYPNDATPRVTVPPVVMPAPDTAQAAPAVR